MHFMTCKLTGWDRGRWVGATLGDSAWQLRAVKWRALDFVDI